MSEKVTEQTAQTIAENHFGKKPKNITSLGGGLSNFIFEIDMGGKDCYIIRISDVRGKINYFLKEQWAVSRAREKHVPTPEILEVGNEIVPFAYMIVRKIEGQNALTHPERLKIIREMGTYAAVINSIPTIAFGNVFDWSSNTLSKLVTWKEYLEKEIHVSERVKLFEENKIMLAMQLKKLKREFKEIGMLSNKPKLCHGDLRLKNLIVDKKAKIISILDWENCSSNIPPYWEISVALHDLTIDEKQVFIEGYGITEKEYKKMADIVKAMNILNYAPYIEQALAQKDKKTIENIKNRFNGSYDLYSL